MHALLPALGLLFALLLGGHAAGPPPACEDVAGTVTGVSLPVFAADSTVVGFRVDGATVAGAMAGSSSATFTIVGADEDGTLHLTGAHTFHDADGAFLFRTEDEGLTTAGGRIENRMTLVEGATGTLETEGTVDFATGALDLAYAGTVCR